MRVTNASESVTNAAHRLVDGFSKIPAEWVRHVVDKTEGEGCCALPMWGTLFKVEDSCDRRGIEKLLRPIGPKGCETVEELLAFISEKGIRYNIAPLEQLALAADDDEDADEKFEQMCEEVNEAWSDGSSGDEDVYFAMDGWQEVGSTGILAREVDGELLLGVNGAGYSFFEAHWIPLYLALGYSWHEHSTE